MNIHYGKAVLSIHECHKGDIYFFTTLRELNPDSGVSIRTSRTSRRFMNIHHGNHGNDMHHLFLWQPFKFVRCVSNGERLHRQRYFIEALVCVTFYRRKLLKSKRLHKSREAVLFGNHRG